MSAYAEDMEKLSAKERVQRLLDAVNMDAENFTIPFFANTPQTAEDTVPMTVVSAESPTPTTAKVVFSWVIPRFYGNPSGNLHGGAAATIYDILTSVAMAPIGRPGFWVFSGVSRVLSVTYIRPAPVGEKVLIECEVVHTGKKMAAIRGVMRRERDGAVLSLCEHDKANSDPPPTTKAKL
ncbi:hypothetical protein MBLNU459_g7773t1 [Dothideomycetes sp. NU459]